MDLKGKPFYLSADEERWVLDALASMDEREKTGQLFCVMGGDDPLDELRALVSDEGIGAVLYRPCPKAELAEKLMYGPVPLSGTIKNEDQPQRQLLSWEQEYRTRRRQ